MTTKGWGESPWGSGVWGAGTEGEVSLLGPTIIPISPTEGQAGVSPSTTVSVRVSDTVSVTPETFILSVGGITYVRLGVAVNGAELALEVNESNGFNAEVTIPELLTNDTVYDINVSAENTSNRRTTRQYTFRVGILPRIIRARNVNEGLIAVYFNQGMDLGTEFFFPGNWKIEAVSEGAAPIEIVEVVAQKSAPDRAILRYTGGGSTYRLTALGLTSASGQELETNYTSTVFDIIYERDGETSVRLFDTIYGVVGVSQRSLKRRNIEDHVALRASSFATDEQFRTRMRALNGTETRSGKPGGRRL
jgi:hypothetical protein